MPIISPSRAKSSDSTTKKRSDVASALATLTRAAGLARKSIAYFSSVYAGFSSSASLRLRCRLFDLVSFCCSASWDCFTSAGSMRTTSMTPQSESVLTSMQTSPHRRCRRGSMALSGSLSPVTRSGKPNAETSFMILPSTPPGRPESVRASSTSFCLNAASLTSEAIERSPAEAVESAASVHPARASRFLFMAATLAASGLIAARYRD